MKTAAAYIRVSTEDQIEFSPDSQLKKIQEYAAGHQLSLPESYIYLDEGISGRSAEKRPAFMKMIAEAKEKPRPFDVILLWKFSRFARNRQDSILYKSMLRRECGIDVISITEQLSDDPTSILIEALLEAMDEYYSINLAQEVRRGMTEKFSRGGVVSIPPFGYQMGSEHFEIEPFQASIVTMIYDDFLRGLSYRQIAAKLNEMGVLSNRGNAFESRTVKYILSNPTYCGKLRRSLSKTGRTDRFYQSDEVTVVDGFHKAIIPQELYDRVQKKIACSCPSHHSDSCCSPGSFMLQGLIRCSNCGATLTRSSNQRSLQCHRYARGQCAQSHSVTLSGIQNALFCQLEQDFQGKSLTLRRMKMSKTPEAPDRSLLLRQEQKRLEKARLAYEAGIDSLEEYRRNKEQIQRQIQKLSDTQAFTDQKSQPLPAPGSARLSKTAAQKHPLPEPSLQTCASWTLTLSVSQFLTLLDSPVIDGEQKNELLRSVLSKVIFNRTESTLQVYYHL